MLGYVIAAVIVLFLLASFRLWRTAVRLDRLHLRTQAAWAALESALSRRAVAARAIAAAGGLDPAAAILLRTAANSADQAAQPHRADVENDLTRVLETLPFDLDADLAEELADAAERVILARRFYNDAVRDTRALRDKRFTRVFRLAGTAALPNFFEIAEYQPQSPQARISARVVLLDQAGRVLLFQGTDPAHRGKVWWFTPGGGVEVGEDLLAAAQRELTEETSLILPTEAFIGPIWWRRARFAFNGWEWESTEHFFLVRLQANAKLPAEVVINTSGFTELEQDTMLGHRWWTIAELRASEETIYPIELAERLAHLALEQDGEVAAAEAIRIR